jgi:hypothetical protein
LVECSPTAMYVSLAYRSSKIQLKSFVGSYVMNAIIYCMPGFEVFAEDKLVEHI